MNFIPRIRPVLFFLILAASFLACSVPGYTEVVNGLYPDRADSTNPAPISTSRVQTQYLNLPMRFEANQGQTDPQVNFISRGSGYTLFLTPNEAVLVLKESTRPDGLKDRPSALRSGSEGPSRNAPLEGKTMQAPRSPSEAILEQGDPQVKRSSSEAVSAKRSFSVLRMKLVGANPSAKVEGLEELAGKSNYFIGDPSQWRTRIPSYKKVEYRDIYPGINLVYYGNQRQLEYDFVVAAGADPGLITLSFEGCEKVEVGEEGDLVLTIVQGEEIRFHKPHVYQEINGEKRIIQGGYRTRGRDRVREDDGPREVVVGFQVAAYDQKSPLVIDPTLIYSTYLGGGSDEYGKSIAVDSSGYAYVTGYTASTNFPTTSGAYQTSKRVGGPNGYDVFVTKLATDGKSLVYSTYLGGTGDDYGLSIAVGSSGYAYVTGYTASTDFPTTSGAYRTSHASDGGGNDAFFTKLAADGASLVYSTYLGGSSNDLGLGIAVDSSGYAYVTGYTSSTNFPTTSGAYQTSNRGGGTFGYDAFVTKLKTDGTGLEYSTYVGGGDDDSAYSIAVDSSGYAYVTGSTKSNNFPTTSGAYQTSFAGGYDASVTKLATDGKSLVYSTYLGGSAGSANEWGYGIAVDSSGYAYVAGPTNSTNFPTTTGAYQTSLKGSPNGFVTKLATDGKTLSYSTYLGGSGSDWLYGIAVDSNGDTYVTGGTSSTNFPTTSGAYQTSNRGSNNVFVTELDYNASHLRYSTYLGGSGYDHGYGIAVDSSGNAYVTGDTQYSYNFPTTSGVYQTSYGGGGSDAFVSKFSGPPAGIGVFNYRMSITVNSGQLPSAQCSGNPLTNFPFLFNTTNANLKTVGNGGHVENANGYDIIFRALDSTTCGAAWDGTSCKLSHEIERYNGATGEFIAWVKVPSINNGTVIYIYYGNPGLDSSTEDRTGVWDSNYKGVWHLPDGTTLSAVNSITGTAGTLTSVTATSGQIDGAANYAAAASSIVTDI